MVPVSCRPSFSSDRDRLDDFGLSSGISTSDPNKEEILDMLVASCRGEGELLGGNSFWRHFEVFGRAPLGFSSLSAPETLSLEGLDSVEIILVVFERIPTFLALVWKFIVDFSLPEDPRSFEKLLEMSDNILTFSTFALNGEVRPLTSSSGDSFLVTADSGLTLSEWLLKETLRLWFLSGESEDSLDIARVAFLNFIILADPDLNDGLVPSGVLSPLEFSLDRLLVTFARFFTFSDSCLKDLFLFAPSS